MSDVDASESRLDAVAETVGEETTEAFKTLGNDARLAILLALWEAKEPGPPLAEQAVPFSELHERVDVADSGQFNYHLEKLVGQFVQRTDEGYALTSRAEQVVRAVLAGTLTDHASFEGEPIDRPCPYCGGSVVIDYSDGVLIERCTDCEGIWQDHEPSGMLTKGARPPVGLTNRTPQEFHRHSWRWTRHRLDSMLEGVCPDCSGTVTTTFAICDDHEPGDTVCEQCGSPYQVLSLHACDVCKLDWWTPAQAAATTETVVDAFLYEHGLDRAELYDTGDIHEIDEHVEVTVHSREPVELLVVLAIDGDRLEVVLDDEARVTDVTEVPG